MIKRLPDADKDQHEESVNDQEKNNPAESFEFRTVGDVFRHVAGQIESHRSNKWTGEGGHDPPSTDDQGYEYGGPKGKSVHYPIRRGPIGHPGGQTHQKPKACRQSDTSFGVHTPTPHFRRVAMVASWKSDEAFEAFSSRHQLAKTLAPGWEVRLQPLHVYGEWSAPGGLPKGEIEVDAEEPVAVLTIGRPRLLRLPSFLKASAAAESEAVANPDALALTGLARSPRLVSTFSIWRNVEAMRAYARGSSDGGRPRATSADRANPFHHESAFIRFRPYASRGSWDGRDPLAADSDGEAASDVVKQGRGEPEWQRYSGD